MAAKVVKIPLPLPMSHAPAVLWLRAKGRRLHPIRHWSTRRQVQPCQASYLCGLAAIRLGYDRMRRRRVSERRWTPCEKQDRGGFWVDGSASKDARKGVMCAP